ncbi:MAG: hypothetical protein H6709_16955 [Kofleriaceae bacterium]|nr:hypothetical protein [Myxococcales bacterium]MCB9573771.1 hypothetical protein [Kofleriaceae bacterium]
MSRRLRPAVLVAAAVALAACSSISTVRVQPENVEVGPGLRPVAAIQANATSAYVLFIPLPGGVSLDRVVNRMLIVAAKTMGADKIVGLTFDVTPDTGIWTIRKIIGWRSARAAGIAVQVVTPAADDHADDGPEPASVTPAPVGPPDAAPAGPGGTR